MEGSTKNGNRLRPTSFGIFYESGSLVHKNEPPNHNQQHQGEAIMAVSKKTAEASKSTAKQDVAGRRVKGKNEPQHAAYAERAIPTRIQEYIEWLSRETGYEVDPRSVYLGSSLRGTFQKSPENQERIAARAQEIEDEKAARIQRAEERAAAKVEREAARASKAEEKAAAAKEAKSAPKEAPAKKAAATKTAAKKAPAKPATSRRRPAKPAAETEDF